MCLAAFALEASPRFPLVLAANRDEFFVRPTAALDWWTPGPEAQPILSGRDLQGGGTWLGLSPAGRLALLTNVRDPASTDLAAPTRGTLVSTWLAGVSLDALRERSLAARHNGFNLVAIDFATRERMHLTNRGVGSPGSAFACGIHGVSNAGLDSPWPKVVALKSALGEAMRQARCAAGLSSALFDALMDDRPAPDSELPSTGVGLEWERQLSSAFILTPDRRYGTRSSTVVITEASGGTLTTHVLGARTNRTGATRGFGNARSIGHPFARRSDHRWRPWSNTIAPRCRLRNEEGPMAFDHRARNGCGRWAAAARSQPQACFLSKNCSSSVEPFSAPVEASFSMVVVTASK